MATRKPRMRGFQAEGAAPLVTGEPFPDPETRATAIRDRQPGLVEARRGRRPRVRRPVPGRSATTRSWPPSASWPRRTACSSSRPRRPGIAGLLADLAQGDSYAGSTVVVTVTGHGLKDTATALEGFGPLVESVVDADVTAAAEAAGLR